MDLVNVPKMFSEYEERLEEEGWYIELDGWQVQCDAQYWRQRGQRSVKHRRYSSVYSTYSKEKRMKGNESVKMNITGQTFRREDGEV
jgi:hypothetical protein